MPIMRGLPQTTTRLETTDGGRALACHGQLTVLSLLPVRFPLLIHYAPPAKSSPEHAPFRVRQWGWGITRNAAYLHVSFHSGRRRAPWTVEP